MRSSAPDVVPFGRVPLSCAGLGLGFGLVALLATSCAPPESLDPDQVETTRGALSGADVVEEGDSSEANVVVQIQNSVNDFCSGTLLTPQIVLTSAHCIFGRRKECYGGARPIESVWIGPRAGVGRPKFETATFAAAAGCPAQPGSDLAVVYLRQPVTLASMKAMRQSDLPLPAVPKIYPATFLSPGGAVFGVAGFGDPIGDRRRVKFFESDGLDFDRDDDDNAYWEIDIGDWQGEGGDSGGALFALNPDGTRHLIGVHKGTSTSNDSMWFTDLTRSGMDAWLRDRITEGNVPSQLQHTAAWLERHGKDHGSWWGQLDYDVIPCDEAGDPDCDGWFNHHDNCPALANPDQADQDDDGIGDACFGAAGVGDIDLYAGAKAVVDSTDGAIAPAGDIDLYADAEAVADPIDDAIAPVGDADLYADAEAVPDPTDPAVPVGEADITETAVVPPPPPPPPPAPATTFGGSYRSGTMWRAFR